MSRDKIWASDLVKVGNCTYNRIAHDRQFDLSELKLGLILFKQVKAASRPHSFLSKITIGHIGTPSPRINSCFGGTAQLIRLRSHSCRTESYAKYNCDIIFYFI